MMKKESSYEAVYAGTKMNHYIIFGDHLRTHAIFGSRKLKIQAIIDYPFSFILDTAFLPITLPSAFISDIRQGRKEE